VLVDNFADAMAQGAFVFQQRPTDFLQLAEAKALLYPSDFAALGLQY
jgi:hypothetical protein